MTEILVCAAILSLGAGIVAGRLRLLWLLAYVATAGAAALAVHAWGCEVPWSAACGAGPSADMALEGVLYLEIVVLATLGWAFGSRRWGGDRAGGTGRVARRASRCATEGSGRPRAAAATSLFGALW
jgi:hypothetical protein